jgi:gamma-glutamyltranspeptidase/glutathione hydrolase
MFTPRQTGFVLVGALVLGLAAPGPVPAQTVTSKTGLVVSTSGLASDAGARILRAGGNAVDAAVTTAFTLAVTYPGAGNIGGGGTIEVGGDIGAGHSIVIDPKTGVASGANDHRSADSKASLR